VSLLTAVEYITPDPPLRVALYRRCSSEDQSINGMGEGDPRLLKITSLVVQDLAFLEHRVKALLWARAAGSSFWWHWAQGRRLHTSVLVQSMAVKLRPWPRLRMG
jgi:hypothetical protein